MDQPDLVLAEAQLEHARALLGRGRVGLFAFLDQRTYPVGLAAARKVAPQAIDHVGQLLIADHSGFDRCPAGRHLVDPADVHFAILGEGQRARDRGRRHHQQMRRALGFLAKQQPLRHPEAVLLVDHRQAEPFVGDLLLEDRMRADEDVDRAVGEAQQHDFPRPALLAAGQDRHAYAKAVELAEQGRVMLAGEDLGRGEERGLGAGFDRGKHRQHGNQGLARADVALEQPQHRDVLRHVSSDLLSHPLLGAGQPVRKLELAGQRAGPPSGMVRLRRDDCRSSRSASWLAKISS